MKATGIEEYGDASHLIALDLSDPPKPQDHDLFIRVKACSVNPVDIKVRNGTYDVTSLLPPSFLRFLLLPLKLRPHMTNPITTTTHPHSPTSSASTAPAQSSLLAPMPLQAPTSRSATKSTTPAVLHAKAAMLSCSW